MNHILTKTFESEFKEDNYKDLVVNLFNRFDFSKECSLKQHFTEDEKQKVRDFTYLGTYEDTERKSLDVLIVELKGGSKVERARNLQRNLIGKYLKGNLKDSAFVAFYSKDNPDWRLSFVRMDYKIGDRGAKVEIGTPPKRYSFLVGKTEPSYTAKKQLQLIISPGVTPTVLDVEKAFNIEKVTKEFYNRIAEMFTKLVGGERKIGSRKIVETGSLKLPSTTGDTIKKEFAVRLIGRLLFCWFLKKKKSDNDIPLIPSEILSSNAIEMYPSYYHSLLEPLFFQVLNTPVEKRNKRVSDDLWSKIPFLNGGLFEPHNHDFYSIDDLGTSKHLNTLKIPDEWFNEIFRMFEEYNFTIDESSTIDIEISVDPEMLGRIFENLLAEINPETGETARKSTGSYYTPRPVVEYMVDESLKQYLITQTGVDDGKISGLLSYAEGGAELTESEHDAIIDALDRVKIIDPACGSGAFPMGILHKMLLILQKIDPESKKWVEKKLSKIENKLLRQEMGVELKRKNWDYIHKLGIIQNSIYGVDIQPIAVEISKLRFFLSLVVDEKIDDDKPNRGVVPLPNLEFKFVAANSLLGLPKAEGGLAESHRDIEKLRDLRDAYFTAYGEDKKQIEKEFRETQERMFRHALNWQATGSQTYKLSEWNPFEDTPSPWFTPEWMFGIKDGFEIVIGNPPYAGFQGVDKEFKELLQKQFISAKGKFDLYIPFIEKSYFLLKQDGFFIFICPTSFTKRNHGKAIRNFLIRNARLNELVDFGHTQMFAAATNYTGVFSFKKASPLSNEFKYRTGFSNDIYWIKQSYLTDSPWVFVNPQHESLIHKIKENSTKLEEIAIISEGIVTGLNTIYLKNKEELNDNEFELNLFMPCLRGKDIDDFIYREPTEFVFYPYRQINGKTIPIEESELEKIAPTFLRYLRKNLALINSREYFVKSGKRWFELWNQRNLRVLSSEKIVTPELSDRNRFALAQGNLFYGDTVCGIVLREESIRVYDLKYILALLNSKLIEWFYKKTTVPKAGGFFIYKVMFLSNIPIRNIPLSEQQKFAELSDQIVSLKSKSRDFKHLIKKLNEMVYSLYGLNSLDIRTVEGGETSQ